MRLVYLPFRAMAEPTRMLLALSGIKYEDEAVWGPVFQHYKDHQLYPFGKTPVMVFSPSQTSANLPESADAAGTLATAARGIVVAQSGSLARHAAKLAGCYPSNHTACAVADAIFELGQELCTINPLVNCYTGDSHDQIKRHYFRVVMPTALPQLERQLSTVGTGLLQEETRCEDESDKSGSVSDEGGVYFAGGRASYGDVNVFHMLNNAMLLEPELLARTPLLEDWYWRVAGLEGIKQYLQRGRC